MADEPNQAFSAEFLAMCKGPKPPEVTLSASIDTRNLREYTPDVKEWVGNASYTRHPNKPSLMFMDEPPVIESGGRKYYHVLHEVTIDSDPVPEPTPPIIWPFLVSNYSRLRLPFKRTYPFGFVPTTPLSGKYREDITLIYPYEMQARFKHQSNPMIMHWLSYIAALQGAGRASYHVTAQDLTGYMEPVPLRQTGKGNIAHPAVIGGEVKWLPSLHELLIDRSTSVLAGTLAKLKP